VIVVRTSFPWFAMVVSCSALTASIAHADANQSALAETLFREGKRLMDEKQFDQACPKLADSYKTEAATGTLLALALCHEGQGKTASAWSEYNDAAARAHSEGAKDREQAARDRALALEPRLSKLTIRLAPATAQVAGVTVKLDGLSQPSAAWGVAIPVDPGDHAVEVMAPSYAPFRVGVKIGINADKKEVSVPALVATSAPPAPAAGTPTSGIAPLSPLRTEPAEAPQGSTLRTAGWVVGGFGVLGLGLGTVFALQASGKNSDSKKDCTADICGDAGYTNRTDAISAGNRATVGFLLGGALVAGGVTMILLGGSGDSSKGASLQASPTFGMGSMGLMLKGRL
jgi:serine/threonine-protein kinase